MLYNLYCIPCSGCMMRKDKRQNYGVLRKKEGPFPGPCRRWTDKGPGHGELGGAGDTQQMGHLLFRDLPGTIPNKDGLKASGV